MVACANRSHTPRFSAFNAPYALSQVGYVPGVILYFFVRARPLVPLRALVNIGSF